MKKETTKCPRCNQNFTEYPALSRRDNKTEICSKCGQEEAMFDYAHSMAGTYIPVGVDVYQREALFKKKITAQSLN